MAKPEETAGGAGRLSPAARAAAQRILDAAARRLLADERTDAAQNDPEPLAAAGQRRRWRTIENDVA